MTNPLPEWYFDPAEREQIREHQFAETARVISEAGSLWELSRKLRRTAESLVPASGQYRQSIRPGLATLSLAELRAEAARQGVRPAPVARALAGPETLPMRLPLRLELWWLRRRLAWRLRGVGDGFHLRVEVPTA